MYTIEQILQTGKDCELSMIDVRYLAERLAEKYSDTAAPTEVKPGPVNEINKYEDLYDWMEDKMHEIIDHLDVDSEGLIIKRIDAARECVELAKRFAEKIIESAIIDELIKKFTPPQPSKEQ